MAPDEQQQEAAMPDPRRASAERVDLARFIDSGYDDPSEPINVVWLQLAEHYRSLYGEPVMGKDRMAFIGDGHVYKLPRSFAGILANQREANWSEDWLPIAECSITVEMPSGLPVLVMERVEPVWIPLTEQPDWVMSVDSAQVGFTRDGRLVAYDL